MDLLAFALRAEYEGDVDVALEDGSTETRPKFGGAVLAVGDGDFHVRDALDAGDGTIVVRASDQRLAALLEVYPPLKSVPVPADARPVSPYERRSTPDLRQLASLRDVDGAGSAARTAVIAALEAQDEAIAGGDQTAASTAEVGDTPDGLDRLKKDELRALAETNDVDVPADATNAQITSALREAGVTQEA